MGRSKLLEAIRRQHSYFVKTCILYSMSSQKNCASCNAAEEDWDDLALKHCLRCWVERITVEDAEKGLCCALELWPYVATRVCSQRFVPVAAVGRVSRSNEDYCRIVAFPEEFMTILVAVLVLQFRPESFISSVVQRPRLTSRRRRAVYR